MPFRKYKPKTRGSKYAKKKSFPGRRKYTNRRPSSKAKYIRKVSRSLKPYAETKKNLGIEVVNQAPVVTWEYTGPGPSVQSNVYTLGFDFSNASASTDAQYGGALNCTAIRQGNASNERIGNYVVGKAISGSFRIAMDAITTSAEPWVKQPVMFKCFWFKSNRSGSPTGTVFNPNKYFFIKPAGTGTGPAAEDDTGPSPAQDMSLLNFYTAPVNRKHFTLLKKMQFTLGPPVVYGDAGHHLNNSQSNADLPSHKIVKFRIPLGTKLQYNESNTVQDKDVHVRLMVLAMPTGGVTNYAANNWTMSMNSVFYYTDL